MNVAAPHKNAGIPAPPIVWLADPEDDPEVDFDPPPPPLGVVELAQHENEGRPDPCLVLVPGIFGIFGFLPVEPFGFFNNFLNLPNFRKLGSQLQSHAQHSQQVEQQQVEQQQVEQSHAVQQVAQSELHGVQSEGVQQDVGAQHVGAQHVGAQQPMQLKSQVEQQGTQHKPQLKQFTSQDRAQAIESNALVHP